ncbi:MAG TPA: integrase arm-type DNA-binding domain-containing protein [Amaricoccus sp.]|uniref:tyrosine-type recombinase/integrase n=1 Tax=Amaricoccus sp. TaxID=1872485 RepID=UPI002B75BC86|nr:integrase arm-type DNA-binding domain-containing protein [Amaricoccus sp.]HMQ91510.1 integrase arm-type DNA-binding domain-containing protein [Amaricoccus sp.]HMR50929.1 integrase arm-type DNA-binding domain-containing protein [Amaricoccus sp.]HMR58900.1 integrase arm-type DNA-binding domain-containing protein [Amaricoccus sp.]HMT97892.1 integrase arm-type DNA-binding domain-containing protein [Amaricoccus sp.]
MLTQEDIDRPNTTGRREKRGAGNGLFLLVTPTGRRSWGLTYRFEGKVRTLPIGRYPGISQAEAAYRCEQARAQLDRGEDPGMVSKRALRETAKAAKARRFDSVAREWFDRTVASRREPQYAARVWSRVEADLLPTLGPKDVAEVEPGDVLAALQAIEARDAVYSAHVVARYASGIFRYARLALGLKHNPAEGISGALLPVPKAVGQPSLAPDKVAFFMGALIRPHEDDELTRLGLRLVMHTVLRSNELRGGRWPEIKGDEWHVPAERMKMKRPHVVPLSRQAAALVARLREISGKGVLMFPGRRPGHPISENTLLFAIYGMGFKGRASVHGWRATFSTWAHESARWPSEWIEACLAHVDKNTVRSAYNRQTWFAQRREIMQAWSDWLDLQADLGELF